jgi:hypothetical protein
MDAGANVKAKPAILTSARLSGFRALLYDRSDAAIHYIDQLDFLFRANGHACSASQAKPVPDNLLSVMNLQHRFHVLSD